MLWRKGCFRGTRMTCQDSSWHWNALPSPSTNTRKLITPLSLAATTNHPLWPPQLPQCCSFHGTPYAHLLPPISSCEFPVSVPSCSFISSGPFHCQMPYKQLGPPLHIPPRPLWGGTHIQDLFRVMPHPGFRFSGLFQRDITSVINYGSKHCLARVVWRQAPSFSTSDVHWYKTLLCNLPVQKSCFFTHNTLRKSSALTFAQSSSDFTCSKTDNVEHFNVKHFRAFFFFPLPFGHQEIAQRHLECEDSSFWEWNMFLEASFFLASSPGYHLSAMASSRCWFPPAGSWERAVYPSAAQHVKSRTQPNRVSCRCWDRRRQKSTEGFEGEDAFDHTDLWPSLRKGR